jgi:hypothetical protein
MLKSYKKALAVLIAVTIMLSLSSYSLAIGENAKITDSLISNTVINEVNAALDYITPEKALYGLSDVDFESLSIGNPILAYEYVDSELAPLSFRMYPLTNDDNDGELVALAIKQDNAEFVSITTALVEQIKEQISSDDAFALVYDSEACYIYTQDGLAQLCESAQITESRDEVSGQSVTLEAGALHSYEAACAIGFESASLVQGASINGNILYAGSSDYISLPVSAVSQNPPSNVCWAASVACIGNYLTSGTDFGAQAVALNLRPYGAWDLEATPQQALNCLSNIYSISYTYYSSAPSVSTVNLSINSGRPLYSRWSRTNGSHACVIYGCSVSYLIMSIMDPESGFTSAGVVSATNYNYTYVSAYSGTTYTLYAYAK